MKYRIRQEGNCTDIDLEQVADNKDQLLDGFRACREGRCQCPTDEYQKLDSMEVETRADGIFVRLRTRPGERLDTGEVEKCLEHAVARCEDGSGGDSTT